MKECPILFSAPMVRALLAGTKTQTRRVVKGCEFVADVADGVEPYWRLKDHPRKLVSGGTPMGPHVSVLCPYGQPGDRLWVREAWARTSVFPGTELVVYREGDNRTDYGGPWKPGIHMFRRDSRITLEVTDVRVERLQDIGEADAVAEGGTEALKGWWSHEGLEWNDPSPNKRFGATAIDSYRVLWEQINGPESWAANPWVWAVSFKRITP